MSNYHQKLDGELDLSGLTKFVIGLILIMAVSMAGLWYGSLALRSWEQSQDPEPPKLEEARQTYEPPAPRLQQNPFDDIIALREHERLVLENYAWVDEDEAMVRVPIERAIEMVAAGSLELIPARSAATRAIDETAEATE